MSISIHVPTCRIHYPGLQNVKIYIDNKILERKSLNP